MRAVIVFNCIIGLVFATIILFQYLLHKSIKKSLYNYRNSSYIAGIIFGFVFMVSLYDYLISCLLEIKSMRVFFIFRELLEFPSKFVRFALPVFIIICLAVIISNIALIMHEGMRLKNILGVFLGILFVGGTFINSHVEKLIEENILVEGSPLDTPIFWSVHTFSQLFIVFLLCYLEVYFIATVIMGYLAAKQVPAYDKDFIIILGCSVDKNGGLPPLLKGRTNRAVKYFWEQEFQTGKRLIFVPSGGKGMDEVISEGSAMENYLLTHGVESHEIIVEKESRSTYENFLFSKRIIDEIEPNAKICFATTNYHMYRSGLIAKRLGINVEGVSSKTKWYFWPNGFVREFIAILNMEKKFHFISIMILALLCIIAGLVSYHVFEMYWI